MKLNKYKTLIFDCDGVILDSNNIKTEAFRKVASEYGKKAEKELINFHLNNLGISRFIKFEHFINTIIPSLNISRNSPDMKYLLTKFNEEIQSKLIKCKLNNDLNKLKENTINSGWFMVTAGDQEEVRKILKIRNISSLFNKGIYGSPKNKYEIIKQEINSENMKFPAIYFGDSKYDYEVAEAYGIDFIFVSDWTALINWEQYCLYNQINKINYISMNNIDRLEFKSRKT